MICKHESAPGQWRFVLAPTRSASWAQIQQFFGLVAGVSLLIAVTFACMGFWPVLPFAGAELALLWYCLYRSAWTHVHLQAAPSRLHPSLLLLGSHGKTVRLGAFLTEEERQGTAQFLRTVLRHD